MADGHKTVPKNNRDPDGATKMCPTLVIECPYVCHEVSHTHAVFFRQISRGQESKNLS